MVEAPALHVGSATHVGPLSTFPVWTDAPTPPRAMRTSLPRGARIEEMPDGPAVDTLRLRNPTSKSFLLPGGTLFDGGWQHRVLVHSILVPMQTDLDLDVRCVEQGRWDGNAKQRLHRRRAPLAVSGALRGLRTNRQADRRADQGDVWSRVQRYERSHGSSPSASLVEVTDRLDTLLGEVLAAVRVLPGQRGVLIGIGGHPVLLEVFDHPRTLESQWEAIIGGVLADAALVPARRTAGHRARSFATRISNRRLEPVPGCRARGEARDHLVAVDGLTTGSDRVVHLTALNVRHDLVGAA